MKRLMIICAVCLMGISAMAQEINAISATQNGTTDWYPFGDQKSITITIDELGNLEFPNDRLYDLTDGDVETEFGTAPAEKITLTAEDFMVTPPENLVYDKTEKKANVKFISGEHPEPSADKITIYYNNDKVVKPINPGTYQVYIDIEETDIYAAVTGITSETWKFEIIDPLPVIKEAAIAEINNVATPAKNTIHEYAVADQVKETAINEIDNAVATAEASINNADSEEQVNNAKNTAQNKINQQLAYVQDYYEKLQAAIAEIKDVANGAKEEIDGLGVDENAKNNAKAMIDNIVSTAKSTINNATSKDAIDNAKTEAIAEIYNVVQNLKDMWISVRENMTIGNYGTLCWNYNLTDIEGAELYRVTGKENNLISLEEVLVSETQAGAGYVILATAETLRVKNGASVATEPLSSGACNGLQGTFEEIVDGVAGTTGNILEGNYIIYNNEWRKCGGYTGLHAYSAYLIMDYVPNSTVTQVPNRKYISMPLPKETPTELESVDGSQCTMHNGKFLRNGQLIIVKDNKMYNAQGIEL